MAADVFFEHQETGRTLFFYHSWSECDQFYVSISVLLSWCPLPWSQLITGACCVSQILNLLTNRCCREAKLRIYCKIKSSNSSKWLFLFEAAASATNKHPSFSDKIQSGIICLFIHRAGSRILIKMSLLSSIKWCDMCCCGLSWEDGTPTGKQTSREKQSHLSHHASLHLSRFSLDGRKLWSLISGSVCVFHVRQMKAFNIGAKVMSE